MQIIKENKSNILINDQPLYVNDYYFYILSIIKYVIIKYDLSINIILGNMIYDFNNNYKTITININYEHTLVKKGGRSIENTTPTGVIQYNTDDKYLVRIDNLNNYINADIIIDYSNPNIYNVKSSEYYNDFSNKHIYISPSIYQNTYINMENRKISSLTTFINVNETRRHKLLETIKNLNLFNNVNINNCFDKNNIEKLYRDTKVIINIHQTPHHDTFEELRCLPALQNGVIIVAEKSPLNHLIPYNDLIIWCDYEDIIYKVKDVLDNYQDYYSKIFTTENIDIINNCDLINKKNMEYNILNKYYKSLDDLSKYYGLDKSISTGCHNYIPGYTKLFQNIRYDVKNLLEIGIGSLENGQIGGKNGLVSTNYGYSSGNSLKCWSDYFPYANIFGIDIYSHPELNNNKIMTYVADQNNEKDLKNVINNINTVLDIIIDDGSHKGEHQVFSFMYLHNYLSPNGIYVIEGIQPDNIEKFKDLSIFPSNFKDYILNTFKIEYFDTRNSNDSLREDDFMMSFTKL
uniref:Methyltransferase domain-containing protein n=1 Tax=viral metagenome TaxID=1070528 RepID=A0A6C0J064_9ZZZZ